MLLTISTLIIFICSSILAFLRLSFAVEISGLFIKNHPASITLAVFLIICAVVIVFISIKKYRFLEIDIKNNISASNFGKVCSILMLIATFLKIVSLFLNFFATKINIGDIIILLLTFITLFYYIAILTLYNKGTAINYISSVALIPVLWSVAILVVNYVSLTQMSTTPEYCYIIFAYVINILFFYYIAKVLSGYKCTVHALIACSFAAVINAVAYLSTTVYNIVKYLTVPTYISSKALIVSIFDNLIFIFIIPFAFSFILLLIKESKEIKK